MHAAHDAAISRIWGFLEVIMIHYCSERSLLSMRNFRRNDLNGRTLTLKFSRSEVSERTKYILNTDTLPPIRQSSN